MHSYQNPVIRGFNPDPSIVRVGEDFYLVTSSFEFFPGVPIYHSRNLVDWTLIGHCLTRDEQLPLRGARNSGGIFAPTIRYHDGTFYMITTNVTSGGNFIVHTRDIRGAWSDPVYVDHRGIDPSLLFDDDGKVYFCSTFSQKGRKPGIAIYQIDPHTGALLSDLTVVDALEGGKFPEAPHMYKIRGQYYLMLAEGGTEYGHMETIFRADAPFGPYERCPHNPILSHKDYMGSPIQATGHADLVDDPAGNWWLVCLGIRPIGYALLHNLGRETFLAPVRWDDQGWPVVGDKGRIELAMEGPLPAPAEQPKHAFSDDFRGDQLDLNWTFVRNPARDHYQLTGGGLLLKPGAEGLDDEEPTMIALRQQEFELSAQARIESGVEADGSKAGLTAYYNKDYHYEIYLTRRDGQVFVELGKSVHDIRHVAASHPIASPAHIDLRIEANREQYSFSYSTGGDWIPLGTGSTAALCTEGTMYMTFTGTFIGPFASGTNALITHFHCQ